MKKTILILLLLNILNSCATATPNKPTSSSYPRSYPN